MDNRNLDIRDDELRIIGHPTPRKPKRWSIWAIVAALVVVAAVLAICGMASRSQRQEAHGVFENYATPKPEKPKTFLGRVNDTDGVACVERLDSVINDVVLSIYIPHNLTPELSVGAPNSEVRKAMLAFQAADIRADNGRILGAFVLKGKPIAWGLSKRGYCGIIDGKIIVGVADDTPLFEKATETEGYFFRQYPLVDNGTIVENEPKNKTMRKAVCDRAGQIMVVVSESDESFHDFAQALADLGVDNAVYLVGSHTAYGWYVNEDGVKVEFAADKHYKKYKNESYILWK